jgi:hypothetical protein
VYVPLLLAASAKLVECVRLIGEQGDVTVVLTGLASTLEPTASGRQNGKGAV